MLHFKHLIIGAGLSGLTSAYYLNKLGEFNFLILESRDRIGGRIYSSKDIDLGATWYQHNHAFVANLMDELHLNSFDQYSSGRGILLYDINKPAHYFENTSNEISSKRISGNSESLIAHLSQSITAKIRTKTMVNKIIDKGDHLKIIANQQTYTAQKVILTIPPKLISKLQFFPKLNTTMEEILKSTPTWMEHAIKVEITYKNAFWHDKNLSGTLLGQQSPLTELYDHCDAKNDTYSLMGFMNEGLRGLEVDKRRNIVLNYVAKFLGNEICDYIEKDWSQDSHNSRSLLPHISRTHNYGHPIFQNNFYNDKLIFSGTRNLTYT